MHTILTFIKEHKIKSGLLFLVVIDTLLSPFGSPILAVIAINIILSLIIILFNKERAVSFVKAHKVISGLVSLFIIITLSAPFFNHSSTEREITITKETQTSQSPKVAIHTPLSPSEKPDIVDNPEVVVLWAESQIDHFYGGIDVDNYLLFKDGTAYKNITVPLQNFHVAKSRKQEQKKWTTWKKSSFSNYKVLDRKRNIWKMLGNKDDAVTTIEAIKANSDEKLNAKYISAGGSTLGGTFKNSITLKPDGRFEMARFSMRNNQNIGGGDSGTPLISSVYVSDKRGSTSNTSTSGELSDRTSVGGGTSSKKKNGSKNTGTYYLDGYTITLSHDNGFEHTELFFFMNRDKKSFMYKSDLFWIRIN